MSDTKPVESETQADVEPTNGMPADDEAASRQDMLQARLDHDTDIWLSQLSVTERKDND